MEGGGVLADILFGKVNPSGKLPFAIAQKESDYPDIKWNTKAQHYGYYHGYHKLDKEHKPCDYPFGFGLSYTTFRVGQPELLEVGDGHAQIAVSVANTGSRAGRKWYSSMPPSQIVLLTARCEHSAVSKRYFCSPVKKRL